MKNMIKEYTLKSKSTPREAKEIKDSKDAFEEFRAVYDRDTLSLYESAYVLFLNSSNKIKGFMKLSDGGMNHVIIDPRTLMMGALGSLSTAIVLSHNHPSGNPRPSEDDRILTKKIMAACKLMDISFVDHIIIAGDSRYYSFRDHGELN
jgi:DNA repair protein RadC